MPKAWCGFKAATTPAIPWWSPAKKPCCISSPPALCATGRGIGPAYEDKVARRAIRMQELFHRERFAAKLGEVLDYHNFVLKNYFNAETVDFQQTLDATLLLAE